MTGFTGLLVFLFFVTALVYASAGLAGGSTYLALLVFFGLPYHDIPKLALFCNLVAALVGCVEHWRAGHLRFDKLWPFLLASVPMAYFGGRVPLGKTPFLLLLGFSLVVAGGNLLLRTGGGDSIRERGFSQRIQFAVPVGLGLGFLSGLVGIGGGIFLAPILYLSRWAKAREIAGMTVLFILCNSLFGFAGQLVKSDFVVDWNFLLPLAFAVLAGGAIGAHLSAVRLPLVVLRRVTAVLVMVAGLRALGGIL